MNTETRNYEHSRKDIFDMQLEADEKAKKYDELKEVLRKIKRNTTESKQRSVERSHYIWYE